MRPPVHLHVQVPIAIGSLIVGILVVACGSGEPTVTPDCFISHEGQVVGANGSDCAPPAGVTVEPTPTFTPVPAGGGATDAAGLFIANGCAGCHSVESIPQAVGQVGPALTGIGTKGEAFIRTSIVEPSAVIAEGFDDGLMPNNFGTLLSSSQLDTLVNFLLTQ